MNKDQFAHTPSSTRMSVVLLAVLWMSSAAPALAAGTDTASSAKAKLANVSHTVKEVDLNAITLSAEAEKSLGITVAKVENKAVSQSRVYGGEVVIPGDRALMVQAPFTGVVQLHGKPLRPGEMVRKGQAILELVPMLSPESRINLEVSLTDMQGQLSNAETQQNIAAIALKRAQQLFEDKAGSQRNVQEAQAVFDQAADTLKALKQRRQLIVDALNHQGSGKVVLRSPIDAILAALSVQPGQVVGAGQALFSVSDQKRIWVRTPVPVGDLSSISLDMAATVQSFSNRASPRYQAMPVAAPPNAVAGTMTVDVYHALDNDAARFSPGQRLSVELQMQGQGRYDTIPWRAVVFDIHGNAWVYEKTADRAYNRKRVVIDHVSGDVAAIAYGPAPGKEVVDNGAQEIFALETGYTK